MTASIQSPADLVNYALRRIGWKLRVGSLYDGSEAGKVALDMYAQVRDEMLRAGDADFSERNITMTLLKQAPPGGYIPPNTWSPAYPSLPWLFEYAYPSDCLKVRAIRGQVIFVFDFDPQPIVFTPSNDDTFTPTQRVILCNVPDAILTYTGQVTDLTNWDVDAIEAFAAALGRRLGPTLVGLKALQPLGADEQAAGMAAEKERG